MEWVLLWSIVALIAGPTAVRLLIAPLFVRRTHWQPARYVLPSQDVPAFLAERSAEFLLRHQQLLELGYVPADATRYALSHTGISLLLYRNEADGGIATLLAASVTGAGEKVMLEFARLRADGTAIGLNNSPTPSTLPAWTRRQSYRLPAMQVPAELRDRFLTLCARLGVRDVVLPPVGKELEAMAAYMNDETETLLANGFLRQPAGEHGRLTLRGAYRACWILSWPLLPLINARDARLAARLSSPA